MEENSQNIEIENKNSGQTAQPDERSGVYVQGHIKIFDPNTGEVFVENRAWSIWD